MTIESALLLAALAAAALVSALWRRSEARLSATQVELESLQEDREELATQLSRERQGRAKQGEELADLRKRLDKSKKRSARAEKGSADLPLGTAARLTDLEAELERAERERDRGRAEREQLASEVATLEARLEVERRPAPALPAPPAPPAPPEPTPAVATAGPSASELVEAQERIGNLQGQLELAKQSEVRMRKRLSNEEQLYASIRSELEVKKDRLRAQDERIQRLEALGVALGTDVEPDSVPDSDLDPDSDSVPDSDLDPDPDSDSVPDSDLDPDESSAGSD